MRVLFLTQLLRSPVATSRLRLRRFCGAIVSPDPSIGWKTTKFHTGQFRLSRTLGGLSTDRRLLSSSVQRGEFDPFQHPSTTALLRQDDCELSAEEVVLKRALEEYQRWKQENDATTIEEKDNRLPPHQVVLQSLERAYMGLEYWEEALQIEQYKCHRFFKSGTDDYADSIHAQGKFYLRLENFDESQRLYREALDYFEATQNLVQQGHVLISLAGWHFFRSKLEEALQSLHRAEGLLDSNPSLLVKCLDNQGLIYRLWGEYDTALDKYQQALQVVDDRSIERALRVHVGDMMMALKYSDQALHVYQDVLKDISTSEGLKQELHQQDHHLSIQGVLLHNIANIHVEQGEYESALEEFRMALEIKEKAGGEHNPEMARTWNSLGGLLAGVFDEKLKALECFQKALWISRIHAEGDPHTDPDVMSAIQNIAKMEYALQEEEKG